MTDDGDFSATTEEHGFLTQLVGRWNVTCQYYVDPALPPIKAAGEESIEMLGEYWAVATFKTEMMGAPFHGITLTGYEPSNSRWVCSRANNITPYLYVSTGALEDGKSLNMKGRGLHPATGAPANFRTTETFGTDERRLEMFVELPDGSEQKLFTYDFVRAAGESS